MAQPTDNERWIPKYCLEEVKERLAKIAKKAAKMGVPPLTMIVTDDEEVRNHYHTSEALGEIDYPVTYLKVIIEGEPPKFAGWSFLARIEHGAANIILSVPGKTTPAEYWTAEPNCDHCKMDRRRKDTFVVQHNDGTIKQVGSSCLHQFLGIELKTNFMTVFGLYDMDELCNGLNPPVEHEMERVLTYTAAVIRNIGWVSGGTAYNEMKSSTADHVSDQMFNKQLKPSERIELLPEDTTIAQHAQEWAAGLSDEEVDGSDYLRNLRAMAGANTVTAKGWGLAVSIVQAWHRSEGRRIAQEREAARGESNWVGEVGKRQEFIVELTGIWFSEGNYGLTSIHRFYDADGNQLTWFKSGENDMLEGGKYKIKATVKDHGEFKEKKQTIINRAKVLEVISEPEQEEAA